MCVICGFNAFNKFGAGSIYLFEGSIMAIFDDLSEICGGAAKTSGADFFFSGAGNCALAFEGKYKIDEFNSTKITLRLTRGRILNIFGKNLSIGTLAPAEIGINGKIASIEFGGTLSE